MSDCFINLCLIRSSCCCICRRVSSVWKHNPMKSGKYFMFDGEEETAWNSAQADHKYLLACLFVSVFPRVCLFVCCASVRLLVPQE